MKIARVMLSVLVAIGVAIGGAAFAQAETGTVYRSGLQGYAAESPLESGTIVQLDSASKVIKPATQSALQHMFGVTVDRGQVPLSLSNEGLQNETYVAVTGTYNVKVSTQGGAIAVGDYITLSSINGVGMKAGTEEATIFGRANTAFNGKDLVLGTASLKDTSGNANQTVQIGSVSVTIDIKKNPNQKSTKANVPEALERIGQAIAEKEVSAIRIYLSLGITIISIIATIAILYSGVRSGVISIGRNPMSKKSIFRALLETIFTSFLILIIGLFAVYLLLKL